MLPILGMGGALPSSHGVFFIFILWRAFTRGLREYVVVLLRLGFMAAGAGRALVPWTKHGIALPIFLNCSSVCLMAG